MAEEKIEWDDDLGLPELPDSAYVESRTQAKHTDLTTLPDTTSPVSPEWAHTVENVVTTVVGGAVKIAEAYAPVRPTAGQADAARKVYGTVIQPQGPRVAQVPAPAPVAQPPAAPAPQPPAAPAPQPPAAPAPAPAPADPAPVQPAPASKGLGWPAIVGLALGGITVATLITVAVVSSSSSGEHKKK